MGHYNERMRQKDLEHRMMDAGRLPNLLAASVLVLYMFYFSGMPYDELGIAGTCKMVGIVLAIAGGLQFIVAPYTNHLLTRDLSHALEEGRTHTAAQRTQLVAKLMHLPFGIAAQVFIVFYLGAIGSILVLHALLGIAWGPLAFCALCCLFGAAAAMVLAYCYAESLCTEYSTALIRQGLDAAAVHKKQVYGMRMSPRVGYHIIMPVLMANGIQFAFVLKQHLMPADERLYLLNAILLLLFNLALCASMAALYFRHVFSTVRQINGTLEQMTGGTLARTAYLPTDLGTEQAYTAYIINGIISRLQAIAADAGETSANLLATTEGLSVSAKETAGTALLHTASVRECVQTMAQLKELLGQISASIANVSGAAEQTLGTVQEGSALLAQNMQKMSEITQANIETITGIKTLSEQIDDVWALVGTIDHLTGKTRTIAFNAEIEATAAGESGENFHIISNEIRRLAATITDSTTEIRERITGIQHASDNLIISSEGGTEKIREGSELFTNLEEKFNELKVSSEVTAESAADIQAITQTQAVAFTEISNTLDQLKDGFDDLAQSAQIISSSADGIQSVAVRLNSIQGGEEFHA